MFIPNTACDVGPTVVEMIRLLTLKSCILNLQAPICSTSPLEIGPMHLSVEGLRP